ncbi:hypothetical protein TELCIR_11793 [Teladorsagia circumcincta]|uniref:Uncharacterized protein n=1 Tax=Teladorsagia circumcincta TaxID=45464 RepID=A0A2G9U8G3_TELCI|nr:hypothetical protein TELCIR_11793 [Teladorsagia circumcincta]
MGIDLKLFSICSHADCKDCCASRGCFPLVEAVYELISRVRRISPSDVRMLANPQRSSDNALVDSVLVANNLVNIMLAASDEELFRRPPNVGALILASNDIDNYIRTHQSNSRQEDRQF